MTATSVSLRSDILGIPRRDKKGQVARVMAEERVGKGKIAWSGRIVAIQPRIGLTRSFDQRHHSYLGYVLRISGTCGADTGEFLIAVGKAAHEKLEVQSRYRLSRVTTHQQSFSVLREGVGLIVPPAREVDVLC